jgi:hypothetical protein
VVPVVVGAMIVELQSGVVYDAVAVADLLGVVVDVDAVYGGDDDDDDVAVAVFVVLVAFAGRQNPLRNII